MSECSDDDDFPRGKIFGALICFGEDERKNATQILHAILCNTDILNWKENTLEIIVNSRPMRNTNIVDLIQYILSSEDEGVPKPFGLEEFVEALKRTGLESEWVKNEAIADELDTVDSDEETKSEEETESEEEL